MNNCLTTDDYLSCSEKAWQSIILWVKLWWLSAVSELFWENLYSSIFSMYQRKMFYWLGGVDRTLQEIAALKEKQAKQQEKDARFAAVRRRVSIWIERERLVIYLVLPQCVVLASFSKRVRSIEGRRERRKTLSYRKGCRRRGKRCTLLMTAWLWDSCEYVIIGNKGGGKKGRTEGSR